MLNPGTGTERALRAVGEILEAEGQSVAIVVVGGSALNLLGVVERVTRDVDVIAVGYPPDAAALVAADLGLDEDWINTGPALQWKQGLPPGLEGRVRWRRYANLNVGVVDRRDLVFLKLYAAADSTGPTSVHYQDLIALRPSDEELQSARAWTLTQDASPDFHHIVDQVVHHVSRDTRTTRR